MAFYADLYGYIARKEDGEIPAHVIEQVLKSSAIFKPCFSGPFKDRAAYYISFACSVKLNDGEDEVWLEAFEMMLKQINFSNAAVSFVHEEVSHIMMYSYVKTSSIQRFKSKLIELSVEESLLST